MLKKYFFVISLIISVCFVDAQNFNRPIPNNYPPYEFKQNTSPTTTNHYIFTPFFSAPNSSYLKTLTILNKDGYIKWYSAIDTGNYVNFQYHEQHSLFSYARTSNTLSATKFFILDSTFNIIDSVAPVNGAYTDIHELQILSNGNYIISAAKDSIVDLTGYTFDGTPGSATTTIKGFVIQEFDSNHNLIFEWNSNDHIHPSEYIGGYNYNVNKFDYVHGNAIEEDTDNNLLVSFRHLDAVYKIDKNRGNTIWILGGTSNQFTFISDPGFSGQHDIRRLANGNITIFDNGNNKPAQISRPIEYALDTVNMTCTKIWKYLYNPIFEAKAMGNYQTLNNGEKVIGYGAVKRPNPSVVHLDNSDNIVSEIFFKDSIQSYRVTVADLSFNFNPPSISCTDNGGSVTLTAPSGATNYEWSNSATTQSITVSDTGTYQVWVSHGIGMTGAEPFHIADIQNPCGVTSIDNASELKKEKKLLFVFDLLGRRISNPKRLQVYVVKYSDGSSELIQWKESYRLKE